MGIPSDAWFREQEWRFRLLPQEEHDRATAKDLRAIFAPSRSRIPILAHVVPWAPVDAGKDGAP